MPRSRHLSMGPILATALAITLLAAACGGEAESGPSATATASSGGAPGAAPPGSASASSAPSAAAPTADVAEIRVSVADGKVSPRPSLHKVKLGQTIRLIVTVDAADEVHVHGYDREFKVAPGQAATLEFRADQAGRFEVETHESELQLLQLQVS